MLPIYQKKLMKPGVVLLGFIALATQIILLREFLTLFSGNELVIGIILANWMLLTGLGAYFGRFYNDKRRIFWMVTMLGILAFLPIITVLGLHYAWYLFFPPGMVAGIAQVFYYSMLIMAPFCIISGVLFTLFSKEESSRTQKNRISDVYAWESFGSLMAGIVVNFILIWIATTFQSLFLIMIAVVLVVFYLAIRNEQYLISGIILLVSFVFGYFFMQIDLDKRVRELAFPSQKMEYMSDSPYGIFTITKHGDQLNYYENNILMASSGDIISKEESVHFAMVQHSNPQDILVLSGIVTGIMEEVTEYKVNSVDYVDVNPEIFKIVRNRFTKDQYKTLNLVEEDPERYLKKNHKKYDVVLINLPRPSTIQLNRYYTQEFFHLLKKNLNEGAVVSVSVPGGANYLSEEARNFLSILYKTITTEFENAMVLSANEDFLLASDNPLSYKIAEKVEQKNIQAEYINSYYIDDQLLEFRSQQVQRQLDKSVSVNRDFSPVFYQSMIKLWMSRFNIQYWIPALIILVFSGFFFLKAGSVYKGVYAAGFAGTTIEIILLLVFQVLFGYVYAVVGIFVMIFMGGLAAGAYYVPKVLKSIDRKNFRMLLYIISVYAFMLPLMFLLFKNWEVNDMILFVSFALLLFIISALTGGVFSVASKIAQNDFGKIASSAYGLDLLGAATGALLFTIYLIPLFGFIWAAVITGLFNLLVVLLVKR